MALQRFRAMVREAVALSRNYRHAAILRQHVRRRYGAQITARPSILIGDALASMDHAPWRRVMILAVLLVIALRGR
jgi:hypothetical protein